MVAKPRTEPGWATLVEGEYSVLRQPSGVKPRLLIAPGLPFSPEYK